MSDLVKVEEKRVYIAGRPPWLPFIEIHEIYDRAVRDIKAMGMRPIDPTILQIYDLAHDEYLKMGDILLETCGAIYLLRGWECYEEAERNMDFAKKLGKEILYER